MLKLDSSQPDRTLEFFLIIRILEIISLIIINCIKYSQKIFYIVNKTTLIIVERKNCL